MTRKDRNLNDRSAGQALLRVSAPMSLGILGVLSVGLADAYFLARLGSRELTAIGFVYPVIVAVTALSLGMSAGANAALSQAMGRGEDDSTVARLALHAFGYGLALGMAVGGLVWVTSPFLFSLLGAQDVVLEAALAYIPWWAASFPLLVATMILNAAFRAGGDGTAPAVIMVLTAVLNIALTPALIFGTGPVPAFGMAGAGMATLAARAVALAVALTVALRRRALAAGDRPLDGLPASIAAITSTGLPAAGSRAINPGGMAIVTAAVATLGDQAVAGFGAAARVQSIALVPIFALSSGLAPVVGQAWGATDTGRAAYSTRLGLWFAIFYGLGVGAFLWIFADPIARLMTDGSASAAYTAQYLAVVGWTLGGYGIVVAVNSALTARSRAAWALGLSLSRIGVLYVPLAWIGVMVAGYTGVLVAAVLANVIAAWIAAVIAQRNGLLQSPWSSLTTPAQRLAKVGGSHDGN